MPRHRRMVGLLVVVLIVSGGVVLKAFGSTDYFDRRGTDDGTAGSAGAAGVCIPLTNPDGACGGNGTSAASTYTGIAGDGNSVFG